MSLKYIQIQSLASWALHRAEKLLILMFLIYNNDTNIHKSSLTCCLENCLRQHYWNGTLCLLVIRDWTELVPSLTLELRLDLPAVWGEASKNVSLCVFDEQQGGPALHQAGHHPGEALPMQPCGKHKSPGGTVAVWQLAEINTDLHNDSKHK